MNVNFLAIAAAILSLIAFTLTYRHATKLTRRSKILWLIGASFLSIPGASFVFYYKALAPPVARHHSPPF